MEHVVTLEDAQVNVLNLMLRKGIHLENLMRYMGFKIERRDLLIEILKARKEDDEQLVESLEDQLRALLERELTTTGLQLPPTAVKSYFQVDKRT